MPVLLLLALAAAPPTVSAAFELDAPVPSRGFDQTGPRVALGTSSALVVWREARPAAPPVVLARLLNITTGAPLSGAFQVNVSTGGSQTPGLAVAWGQGVFAVVVNGQVRRYAEDGTPGEVNALNLATSGCDLPAVTADATSFIVACARSSTFGITMRRVPFSGALAPGAGVNVASSAEDCHPAVAVGGGVVAVSCSSSTSHVAYRLDPSTFASLGTVSLGPISSGLTIPLSRHALAFDGTRFVAAWKYTPNVTVTTPATTALVAARAFQPDGTLVGSAPLALSSASLTDTLALDDGVALACITPFSCATAYSTLSGATYRLDSASFNTTTMTSATPQQLEFRTTPVRSPALGVGGGMLVWARTTPARSTAFERPFTSFPTGGGTPAAISLTAHHQRLPAAAFDGTHHLVAWLDDRTPEEPAVYAMPVSRTTPAGASATLLSGPTLRPTSVEAAGLDGTFLVTFLATDPNTSTTGRWGVRVSSAGAVLDAPVPLGSGKVTGANPKRGFLITHQANIAGSAVTDLVGRYWKPDAGAPGPEFPIALDRASFSFASSAATRDGDELVMWFGSPGFEGAYAVSQADGGFGPIVQLSADGGATLTGASAVASDGERFLIARLFGPSSFRTAYVNIVEPQTGARQFAIEPAVTGALPIVQGTLTFDGTDYLLSWRSQAGNVSATRITRAGTARDGDAGFLLQALTPGATYDPSVLAGGALKRALFGISMPVADGGHIGVRVVAREVSFANAAPVAAAVDAGTPEDTPVRITTAATDDDDDRLTFELVTTSDAGTAFFDGGLWFAPAADFNGTATFSYAARDDRELSAPAPVTVVVSPVNDAPRGADSMATVLQGTRTVVADLSDVDGDALTLTTVTAPANGTLAGAGPSYAYTSAPGFRGSDSFRVRAADASGASTEVVVNLTVLNAPPAVQAMVDDDSPRVGRAVTFSATSSDPGADPVTLTWDFADAGTASGPLAMRAFTAPGEVVVRCTASDGIDTAVSSVTVRVRPEIPDTLAIAGPSMLDEGARGAWTMEVPPDAPAGLTFSWDFGDGSAAATGAAQEHVFADEGTFTLRVTATAPSGESSAVEHAVTVRNVAPSPAAVETLLAEAGREVTVQLSAADPGATDRLTWAKTAGPGELTASGAFRWVPEFGIDGTFDVSAEVDDADGGKATLVFSVRVMREVAPVVRSGCRCDTASALPLVMALALWLRRRRH